eukprot:COSAG03_NODE_3890_length_1776_cov_15.344663_2_plen_67_part_00
MHAWCNNALVELQGESVGREEACGAQECSENITNTVALCPLSPTKRMNVAYCSDAIELALFLRNRS